MKNKVSLIFALVIFLPESIFASDITLSQSVDMAWNSVPLFKAQLEARTDLYKIARQDQIRRFLLNEPQGQYSKNDDATSETFTLNESFGFPGKAFALSRVDKALYLSQFAEYQAKKYDIARDVLAAYLDAAISAKLVDQQKRNIEDLETLQKSLQARYEAGMATQAETLVNELQIRQQKADLAGLEDKAKTSSEHMKRLLAMNPDSPMQYELPDDLDPRLLEKIGDSTADELRAEAAAALAEANASVSRWVQMPDLNLGLSRNHYLFLPGSPSGKPTTHGYMLGITLPIFYPFHERADSNRQRAQSNADKSNAEIQKLNALKDREDAWLEYNRDRNRLKELRDKDLPYAEALMESTFSAYKSGKLGMAELVLARKTLTDLRAQDVQLRGAIIQAHIRCLNAGGHNS